MFYGVIIFMAIYHLHVQIISRGSGRSSVAAAAYRAGEKLYQRTAVEASAYRSGEELQENRGIKHDYTRKTGIVHTEIILPENAPREYQDRATLWNAVEQSEKRKDAQIAREIDIALPIEFNLHEQKELLREYIKENFVDKGMCADFAIHDKGDGNPHAHIMLTTREVSEKGLGAKNRDWNKVECLESWRENWAATCNVRLSPEKRIDHRTLKAQGIDREPTIHIGPAAHAMEKRGISTERGNKNWEIIARNAEKTPERTAQRLFEARGKYFTFDFQISEIKAQISYDSMESRRLEICVEHMEEARNNIRNLRNCLADYEKQRRKIHFWESKKDVDNRIWHISNACGQAERYFENTYGDSVENFEALKRETEIEIEKLRTHERLKSAEIAALRPIHEQARHEYKKRKLLAEIRDDYPEIKRHMAKLSKAGPPKSWEERQYRMVNEYRFDEISENEMWDIAKTLPDRQARQVRRKWEKDYFTSTVLYRRERVRERCR